MQRGNLDDLLAILAVGKRGTQFHQSGSEAACRNHRSATSFANLESRLGGPFAYTAPTRSVAPRRRVNPASEKRSSFEEIDAELAAVRCFATARRHDSDHYTEYSCRRILFTKCERLSAYPGSSICESFVDYGLSNIVAEGYDGRCAQRASSPQAYRDAFGQTYAWLSSVRLVFSKRPEPKKPQDLIGHTASCDFHAFRAIFVRIRRKAAAS